MLSNLIKRTLTRFPKPTVKSLTNLSQRLPKRPFSILNDKDEEALIYFHNMEMKKAARQATRLIVDEEYIKQIPTPGFVGVIGVNLNDLQYFAVDMDHPGTYKNEDRNVNLASNSWMRVVFDFESNPEMK